MESGRLTLVKFTIKYTQNLNNICVFDRDAGPGAGGERALAGAVPGGAAGGARGGGEAAASVLYDGGERERVKAHPPPHNPKDREGGRQGKQRQLQREGLSLSFCPERERGGGREGERERERGKERGREKVERETETEE